MSKDRRKEHRQPPPVAELSQVGPRKPRPDLSDPRKSKGQSSYLDQKIKQTQQQVQSLDAALKQLDAKREEVKQQLLKGLGALEMLQQMKKEEAAIRADALASLPGGKLSPSGASVPDTDKDKGEGGNGLQVASAGASVDAEGSGPDGADADGGAPPETDEKS